MMYQGEAFGVPWGILLVDIFPSVGAEPGTAMRGLARECTSMKLGERACGNLVK
jgi:hypothetical protein